MFSAQFNGISNWFQSLEPSSLKNFVSLLCGFLPKSVWSYCVFDQVCCCFPDSLFGETKLESLVICGRPLAPGNLATWNFIWALFSFLFSTELQAYFQILIINDFMRTLSNYLKFILQVFSWNYSCVKVRFPLRRTDRVEKILLKRTLRLI